MIINKSIVGVSALAVMNSIGAFAETYTQFVSTNPSISITWAVPEMTAQFGAGNIYMQLNASANSYAAFGIGTEMRSSQMFVVYPDGLGGVTLSTRLGTGHVMPQYSARMAELLSGSGIVDQHMVANILCRDCQSLSFTNNNSWIAAWRDSGDPVNSNNPAAPIRIHDGYNFIDFSLQQAVVASDVNPFVDSNGNRVISNGIVVDAMPDDTMSSDSSTSALLYGHGVIMLIVWTTLYPLGALLMPLVGVWISHAAFQMVAFFAMWAGLALGYIVANRRHLFWNNYHTRIGIIVCGMMALQPILGALHHMDFKKNGQRGPLSHVHVWYGRILMIVGAIDGGLGLWLAQSRHSFKIAYIVLAAAIAGVYILATPLIEYRKASAAKKSLEK